MNKFLYILLFSIAFSGLFSCKKWDEKITASQDAKLEFSTDTIIFDTLFSSIGSATRAFFVYNRNKNAVKISSIQLAGMALSDYTIIVDGYQGFYLNDLELNGHDSILVLVKVLINPHSSSTPYLVADSIMFLTNGNSQQVKLIAYGRDANFLNNITLPCNTTWNSSKPYVLYNTVTIPAGCTLTISKGTKVFVHHNSFLDVKGTLLIMGAPDSLVTFSGDNLDQSYYNVPGQWGGIIIETASKNNTIDWALIKNAETGIKLEAEIDGDTIPELKISNSILRNMSEKGIEANATDIYGYNCLIFNCAENVVAGLAGGTYIYRYCTFANYSYTFFRQGPAVKFSNTNSATSGSLYARLINTIIWGDLGSDELMLSDDGFSGFDFKADNSDLLKTTPVVGSNNIYADPKFLNPATADFHLDTISVSPAANAGQNIGITNDLDNKTRDSTPSIGAYE
jgi:hypothetical protein